MAESRELISLREYVDIRFDAQEKAVQSALASADRAVAKAEAASDKRFEAVNEFRASLNDNTRTLMPRAEYEQAIKAVNEKIETLTARINTRDDRGRGIGEGWAFLASAIGLIVSVITVIVVVSRSRV
jgi:hypothetical protein